MQDSWLAKYLVGNFLSTDSNRMHSCNGQRQIARVHVPIIIFSVGGSVARHQASARLLGLKRFNGILQFNSTHSIWPSPFHVASKLQVRFYTPSLMDPARSCPLARVPSLVSTRSFAHARSHTLVRARSFPHARSPHSFPLVETALQRLLCRIVPRSLRLSSGWNRLE